MVTISQTILVCFHILALLASAKGALVNCVCTTDDCKRDQKTICSATLCYVQYFAQTIDDVGKHVVRGCIDSPNPILCDNKRPAHINDPWPVLTCCAEDWCNRDVIPTAPPWLVKASKKNETKDTLPEYSDKNILDTTQDYKINPDEDRNRKFSMMINPIYISVPIAGACVLLAIIIFAIFLLKRKNYDNFYRNYNITNNANELKHSECCAVENGAIKKPKSHTYPETERTSASSESKLLMKV